MEATRKFIASPFETAHGLASEANINGGNACILTDIIRNKLVNPSATICSLRCLDNQFNERLSYTDSNGTYHSLPYQCPAFGPCKKVNTTSCQSLKSSCPSFLDDCDFITEASNTWLYEGSETQYWKINWSLFDFRVNMSPVMDLSSRQPRYEFLIYAAALAGKF